MALSESIRAEIRQWMDLYPPGRQRSATLPALHIIQREIGYCPVEAQNELAEMLGVAPAEVGAVVGFYNMFHEEPKGEYHIEVCTNVPCMLRGAGKCLHHLEEQLGIRHGEKTEDGQFALDHMECLGSCGTGPMAMVTDQKTGATRYFEEIDSAQDASRMLEVLKSGHGFDTLERWTPAGDPEGTGKAAGPYRHGGMEPRYLLARVDTPQSHTLASYEADGGYATTQRVLTEMEPAAVIDQVKASGIRGRGGAGFPTGVKWGFLAPAFPRYLVVNADESEPGTFKDRMIMEYDPHQLIEGVILSSFAIQAELAFIYIRGEYYFAYTRLVEAVQEAKAKGYLGKGIFGTDKNLEIIVHRGAGAYECGEETALLASLEGKRGMPRLRPPFPAESGYRQKPTLVNNVESLALVPWIFRNGAERFAALGTPTSKGTKVFALAGKVRRGGLIEVPMGITIRQIVEEIGGGVTEGRRFKAVQVGGPSGGCVPADLADTPIDFEALSSVGAIMGSGGLVVLDDRDCMVDIARYFLHFTQDQSCGKCTLCRVGTRRMLDILDRICSAQGRRGDLEELESLARAVRAGSICGLGKTAPNPVLSTLQYFHDEYVAHLEGRCPAGKCQDLIVYKINDQCIGCTLCAQHCPVNAIPLTPYKKHTIDDQLCTRCDTCRDVCPTGAVYVE